MRPSSMTALALENSSEYIALWSIFEGVNVINARHEGSSNQFLAGWHLVEHRGFETTFCGRAILLLGLGLWKNMHVGFRLETCVFGVAFSLFLKVYQPPIVHDAASLSG